MDTDFVEYITASKQLALFLYYNHSSKFYDRKNIQNPYSKIEQSRNRINLYLQNGLEKGEIPLLLEEYGSSEREVTELMGRMTLYALRLNHKYGDNIVEKLTSSEFNQAYSYAETRSTPEARLMAPFSTLDYCVQCPGANCENCGPGQNPDEGGIWLGNGDSGDASGANCPEVRRRAARKRDAVINNAWREFAVESLACAGSAQQAAVQLYGATWYLNVLGPEAPFAVAALGSVGVGGTCLWLSAGRLESNLQIAHSDYYLDVSGQGCNP